MNKVIYISIFPLTDQLEKYLLIRGVIDAGITVEFWDLSNIYFKNFIFQNVISPDYVRKIDSLSVLEARLRREDLKNTLIVSQVNFGGQVLSLYFLLTRLKCRLAFFSLAPMPPSSSASTVADKIKKSLFSKNFFRALLNLWAKICKKTGLVKQYDTVFAAGEWAASPFRAHSDIVSINYHDHDKVLSLGTERLVAGDYCVFLDEGTIHNEDAKILKMGELEPKKFFETLNRTFAEIETKFNVKVVVAAHPGIHYDKSVFEGRDIYLGKTCELVKDCKFTISQSSASISFAVLYNKPIVFIYTDEYVVKRPDSFKIINIYSNAVGAKIFNIDSREDMNALMYPVINTELYDSYKYGGLTSKESEGKYSKDIMIKYVRNLK